MGTLDFSLLCQLVMGIGGKKKIRFWPHDDPVHVYISWIVSNQLVTLGGFYDFVTSGHSQVSTFQDLNPLGF